MPPLGAATSFSLSEEDDEESESEAAAKNRDMIGVGGHSAIGWGLDQTGG